MAINVTVPEHVDHLILQDFRIDKQNKIITILFFDGKDFQTYSTKPLNWAAALVYLFDDLTNAAELLGRIEQFLLDEGLVGGTIVAD